VGWGGGRVTGGREDRKAMREEEGGGRERGRREEGEGGRYLNLSITKNKNIFIFPLIFFFQFAKKFGQIFSGLKKSVDFGS
jgi:hypothetical protein